MPQVDILMAAYNGGDFIEAQLLSIIAQKYTKWKLYIHDDGSDDDTLAIVKKWTKFDDRIVLVEDDAKHLGVAQNFLHLLQFSQGDYCMFCDQDDIWFDNKIALSVQHIQNLDNSIPQLVYADSYVWLPREGIKGKSTLAKAINLQDFLFLNGGTRGCLSIFNTELRYRLNAWQGSCAMHDHLLQLYALSFGAVHYLSTPLMLYRNHEKNVTGETDINIYDPKRLAANRGRYIVDYAHYQTVFDFYERNQDFLPVNKKSIISAYLMMSDKHLLQRIQQIVKYKFSLYNSVSLLLVKLLMRPFILKNEA